jgi:predicted membrane protein
MKDPIQMPFKYVIFFIFLFLLSIIFAIVFFSNNYVEHKKEIKELIEKEIQGKIQGLKNENRGSYYIEVSTLNGNFKIHSLPIAWEIEEYNIQIGDSISKESNSRIMTFYKAKNGVFEKCCDYEIGM